MLRSFATCVSAEIFISLSWAMSIVGAPSGRSGATNFFELIGGFFSLWGDLWQSESCSGFHPSRNPSLPKMELSPWFLVFGHPCEAPDSVQNEKFYQPWSEQLRLESGDDRATVSSACLIPWVLSCCPRASEPVSTVRDRVDSLRPWVPSFPLLSWQLSRIRNPADPQSTCARQRGRS